MSVRNGYGPREGREEYTEQTPKYNASTYRGSLDTLRRERVDFEQFLYYIVRTHSGSARC